MAAGGRLPAGPDRPTSDEIDRIIDLIVAEQARSERNIPSLGLTRDGVVAELGEFEPQWTETVRVERDDRGEIVGAVISEYPSGSAKAWVHGPWVDAPDETWSAIATRLVDAMIADRPATVTSIVANADVDHYLMALLAADLGWSPAEINHALVVDADTIGSWPPSTGDVALRVATEGDADPIRHLHDAEFPSTYHTVEDLLARSSRGEHRLLVACDDDRAGHVIGYIAGRIQADGDGYIDFVAVDDGARRRGVGRALVAEMCRLLVPDTATSRVCLTVQDQRVHARSLYDSLGFAVDVSIAAYRSAIGSATIGSPP